MYQYKALPFLPQLHFFSVKCGMSPRSIGQQAAWPDSQSSGPGFESRSYHWLNLFHGGPEFKSSATLVNIKIVCVGRLGFLTLLCSIWIICFSCLLGPTSLRAINTAEGKYRHVTRDISTHDNFEILLITHQSDCCEMYVTLKIALYLVLWMTDIDECARGQHDCGRQQTCVNNDGSYSCACSRGYEASGRSCFGQCLQWKFV